IMLRIERVKRKEDKLEMVELKGEGHPDSICDTLCELSSKALSKYYLKHSKQVLHHNVDKGLLIGGEAKPSFNDGKIMTPIRVIIGGRATSHVGSKKIPVDKIITDACNAYLKRFSLAKFKIIIEVRGGAANLTGIAKKHVANDTSFGVSHYPFSKLEKTVLDADKFITALRKKYRCIGQDIKIMGVRDGKKISLTIAIAFVGKYICDMKEYTEIKEKITKSIKNRFKADVKINTLDNYKDVNSIYLTVSGLSSEQGDDGQVGRGNRYNGLITPCRSMSLEAVAGKNIYHPGKLYQILAFKIAKDLVKEGAKFAEVQLLTEIGAHLDKPKAVHIRLDGRVDAKAVVERNLRNLSRLQRSIIFGGKRSKKA
ncbi:MAG: methionine adenosyltransferase, partial [Nanoarchaeota archaeon]|nr:methionine adenosyltransferase [Nanoarchaeota archaeon]